MKNLSCAKETDIEREEPVVLPEVERDTMIVFMKMINILHSVKKQVQLHFSCTAVSSEDSSATDLLMLQT